MAILKKYKLVIPKLQHLQLAKKCQRRKRRQLNLAYKTIELLEDFWNKETFETENLSQYFDITRAHIRKIVR